jgi:hypothetical protein
VTDLDDERLSAESGSLGLWQPFEFLVQRRHRRLLARAL